jgi:protein ImuB
MAVAVKSLPILALPVEDKVRSWLVRLGLLTLEDLARIPRQVASSRLGSQAKWVLQLLQGQDSKPLLPYVPLALPEEKLEWDEALSGSEPLLFVLRGLTSRVATRLQGRGLAALALEVTIFHDRAVSRLKEAPSVLGLRFELATPLYRAEELFKVLSARVSRTQLVAPSIGLELKVLSVSVAHQRQLELASARSQLSDNPESMAVLFGELAADIGRHRFGTLQLMDSHRPEKLSLLQVVALNGPSMKSGAKVAAPKAAGSPEGRTAEVSHSALELYPNAPTRLLKQPLLISAPLRKGTMISLGCQLYCVEQVQFERRLEEVEWWSRTPISRDYVRLWLKNAQSVVETLAYVDRNTGQRYIQGIYD